MMPGIVSTNAAAPFLRPQAEHDDAEQTRRPSSVSRSVIYPPWMHCEVVTRKVMREAKAEISPLLDNGITLSHWPNGGIEKSREHKGATAARAGRRQGSRTIAGKSQYLKAVAWSLLLRGFFCFHFHAL
jgi:hypothetical protein